MIRVFRSITEIEANLWNSLNSSADIFHEYWFLRAVERANVENSQLWYCLCYDQGELVATTVLSAFNISLDLFAGDNQLIRTIKKHFPNFFNIRILFCGLPVSLGQKNISFKSGANTSAILKEISDLMNQIAKEEKIKFQCVKEFKTHQLNLAQGLEEEGYFQAYSIPYISMPIQAHSFEEYLGSLRHHYRRKILLSLKKIGMQTPFFSPPVQSNGHYSEFKLVEGYEDACPPENFYQLYMKVMERAPTKLETLNLDFFKQIIQKENSAIKILSLKKGNDIQSAAMVVGHGDTLTWMLVGHALRKYPACDPYFNMLYAILSYAIDNGYKKLNLGQASYPAKQRIGGAPEDEFIFFKTSRPFVHWCLKKFKTLIFPPLVLPQLRVFKQQLQPEIQKV